MKRKGTVTVIGAGASGLVCAYILARAGLDVTVFEKNSLPGKKLSMTGNGVCNLTNLNISAECYNEEARKTVSVLLEKYTPEKTVSFFKELGILTRDRDGYVYPVSGEAESLRRALVFAAKSEGVVFKTGVQVKRIEIKKKTPPDEEKKAECDVTRTKKENFFRVTTDKGSFGADKVVLASGGLSGPKSTMSTGDGYYMAKLLGIPVTKTFPALTPLISDDVTLKEKKGVRFTASVRLKTDDAQTKYETGEIQFTDKTVSGIPVMQLSALAARFLDEGKSVSLEIDFFPDMTDGEFDGIVDIILNKPACREEARHSFIKQSFNPAADSAKTAFIKSDRFENAAPVAKPEAYVSVPDLREILCGFAPDEINEFMLSKYMGTKSCTLGLTEATYNASKREKDRRLNEDASKHEKDGRLNEDTLKHEKDRRLNEDASKRERGERLDSDVPHDTQEINPCLTVSEVRDLLYSYRKLTLKISGVSSYERAQATSGGIDTAAFTVNMESLQVPGFFAVGEVLDVCGKCGGYNLQWAFMSAMAAAEKIISDFNS